MKRAIGKTAFWGCFTTGSRHPGRTQRMRCYHLVLMRSSDAGPWPSGGGGVARGGILRPAPRGALLGGPQHWVDLQFRAPLCASARAVWRAWLCALAGHGTRQIQHLQHHPRQGCAVCPVQCVVHQPMYQQRDDTALAKIHNDKCHRARRGRRTWMRCTHQKARPTDNNTQNNDARNTQKVSLCAALFQPSSAACSPSNFNGVSACGCKCSMEAGEKGAWASGFSAQQKNVHNCKTWTTNYICLPRTRPHAPARSEAIITYNGWWVALSVGNKRVWDACRVGLGDKQNTGDTYK